MELQQLLARFEQDKGDYSGRLKQTFGQLCTLTDQIPLPGSGQTYQRWQILAQVAATDLVLAKWFESHLDAIAILAELGLAVDTKKRWAIWAAEGSPRPLVYAQGKVSGLKTWCSAAALVDFGLITCRNEAGQSQLLIVEMQQPGVGIDIAGWQAIGMYHTATATISLNDVVVQQVGEPDDYLKRAGFWHGAAGVAACWFGASVRLAEYLRDNSSLESHPYRLAGLGKVDALLSSTKILFQRVAEQIDQQPQQSHQHLIRILRAQVEQNVQQVIQLVGEVMGARPYCEQTIFARLMADLPVFIRQSHAAFDLAEIARLYIQEQPTWRL